MSTGPVVKYLEGLGMKLFSCCAPKLWKRDLSAETNALESQMKASQKEGPVLCRLHVHRVQTFWEPQGHQTFESLRSSVCKLSRRSFSCLRVVPQKA